MRLVPLRPVFLRHGQPQVIKTQIKRSIHSSRALRYVQQQPPFKAAIIGSGPAGFYTAYRLMEKLPDAHVDMFEALPVPFGLSRFGVAPDHPEVKNCQEKFEEVAAQSSKFRFYGNVRVGQDVSLETVKNSYNCVVLAYGSNEDRHLGVPGEDLPGVFSARQFVGWYNGLPELAGLDPPLDSAEDVVIIGNGNVALDVARILSCDVTNRLKHTDIAEHAYEKLRNSTVKNIRIVARRGLLQSAFTTKEIRELIREPGVTIDPVDTKYLEPFLRFEKLLQRPKKRMLQLLTKIPEENAKKAGSTTKHIGLDYLMSPVKFFAHPGSESLLSVTQFEINRLYQDDIQSAPRVDGTGEYAAIKSDLAFKSIGYKAVALPGFQQLGIPFDESRGMVPNLFGKVIPGIYVAGWVKNGPTGVIAETMRESFEVAESVIQDYYENKVDKSVKPGIDPRNISCNKGRPLNWSDWKKIDEYELALGKEAGKERVKLVDIDQILELVG